MGESGYSLISAGCFYFGNWGKAIIASGLSYAKIRRKRVGCFGVGRKLFKVGEGRQAIIEMPSDVNIRR